MDRNKRKSGIASLGEVSWGTHFCHFYRNSQDLIDILLPFFLAGIENNELCLWIVAAPLHANEAIAGLKSSLPDFDELTEKGLFRIVPAESWPEPGFTSDSAIWTAVNQALYGGCDGLRFACNAHPSGGEGTPYIIPGAGGVNGDRVIAAYGYAHDRFEPVMLLDAARHHQCALVIDNGEWKVHRFAIRYFDEALEQSRKMHRDMIDSLSEGFANYRIILNNRGIPCDYLFLEVNKVFETITGLRSNEIIGRRASETLKGINADPASWIASFGCTALTGKSETFEASSEEEGQRYMVSVFSSRRGFFSVLYVAISPPAYSRKRMTKIYKKLSITNDELATINEELSVANEMLREEIEQRCAVELALRESEKRYRDLVRYAPAAIYEIEYMPVRFTEVNDVMCRILGYSREDLLAMGPDGILARDAQEQFATRLEKILSGEEPPTAEEYMLRTADDRRIWVLINATFHRCDGKIVGASVIATDITERKEAEAGLQRRTQELRASNEELERFNRAMVNRELCMIEQKRQVNQLRERLGEPPLYNLAFEEDDS